VSDYINKTTDKGTNGEKINKYLLKLKAMRLIKLVDQRYQIQ